ncbi:recombination-associated protein RdgC [Piscinibacter gummiphilus]|uniref:Recombination-associated protein RdgC n=1 Tax=Piscinibacter gummiphilus TaxID=946333 RepID=A0ABZ0CUB0_9BURK|nr:recombination-associated protein RdgC [Piscinibacter gummiphilus]WOB06540.1 recombination-associated protein RdgC [Piscinibacter gummiphilus]
MFKNLLVYALRWDRSITAEHAERAASAAFVPCTPTQQESAGWVPPRGEKHGEFIEWIDGQAIMKLCIEKRSVPSAAVKEELEKRLDKIEADTGRRPKGKKAKEIKEEVVHELLPRAFAKRSNVPVWINQRAGLVMIGAGSTVAADRVASMLVDLLGGAILTLLQTDIAPATAMSIWLKTQTAPPFFSIDRECELRQPDGEKSVVRYNRHTLDIEEVREHIEQGKLPTQVAMTWNGRASFVLTEAGALKKIQLLDVALEGKGDDTTGFDADVAIFTGEFKQLLVDLIDALGGLLQPAAA